MSAVQPRPQEPEISPAYLISLDGRLTVSLVKQGIIIVVTESLLDVSIL